MNFLKRFKSKHPLANIGNAHLVYSAFPMSMREDVDGFVLDSPKLQIWTHPISVVIDSEKLDIPARIYCDPFTPSEPFPPKRETIYDCLYSRHHDGFLRELSVRRLMEAQIEPWIAAYLFIALGDYVIEVAGQVCHANEAQIEAMKKFANENPALYAYVRCQTISYFNEYYRDDYKFYQDYPPFKLIDQLKPDFLKSKSRTYEK